VATPPEIKPALTLCRNGTTIAVRAVKVGRRYLVRRHKGRGAGLVAVVLIALATVTFISAPAGAATTFPATLRDERLSTSPSDGVGILTVTRDCDPVGTSTVSWTMSGTAAEGVTGPVPYPGTFTETGTLIIGPQTGPGDIDGLPAGPVASLDVSFEIVSGTTRITGTKTLATARFSPDYGICVEASGQPAFELPSAFGHDVYVDTAARYSAVIETDTATYKDRGKSSILIADTELCSDTSGCADRFRLFSQENFSSSRRHASRSA
jgi:hypothetical protein